MSIADAIEQSGVPKSEFEKLICGNNQAKIENALKRGNRIEIVPGKNGVKVLEVKRSELK